MSKWFSSAQLRKNSTFGKIANSVAAKTTESAQGSARDSTFTVETASPIEEIAEYRQALQCIKRNKGAVLVTGGAGTGKSTLIRWLQDELRGEAIVAAPTGIAAITAGGQTIHSMCNFPPAWLLPSDIKKKPKSPVSRARVLILDEISMVNANLLDAVDQFLKLNRNSEAPFGGISIMMIGDLFQLPPIVTQETRDLFNSNYSSAKFFAAKALQNLDFDLIELTKPFRQQDEKFHTLLKNLREGTSLKPTLETFNRKVTIAETGRDGAVSLCPRNADADFVNQERLGRLNGKEIIYSAKTSGVFRSNPLPAPAELCLRVGAQVVMTCNAKYWVNGSVAKVTEIDEDRVEVLLSKQNRKVEVRPNVWNQYEYRWSETTKQIEREVVGTYTQMPINLAWAMTIHKSQGLTLDEVHVDLGRGSFDTGQTYVALSRSRKIESLSLARPLQERDILIDLEARAFYDECRQSR